MTFADADPLTKAHIAAQERLRVLVAGAVARAWQGLPGYDEANVSMFLSAAVPAVLSGQRTSVALTRAFIGRHLGARPVNIDTNTVIGAAVRAGTPPQDVYRRPFRTVWAALSNGTAFDAAVAAGLARATSTADMDVQLSSRATFAAVQQADPRIRGYQRVPDGGACAYCLSIAGAFVRSADAMPLHNRCGCSLEPVLDAVHVSPVPDTVAVHEHGELGPVLTASDHHFTTEHQALAA